MPNRLFHYQKFVKEHLVSLLSEGKIKFSRPNNFNDPWDCRVHYRVPTDLSEKTRLFDWLMNEHRKQHPGISESERARCVQNSISNLITFVGGMEKGMYS